LYGCDEEVREEMKAATNHLLNSMGLEIIDYSENKKELFMALPSKDLTSTMIPAIVTGADHQLVCRGLAAIQTADDQ
ncbi:MAG: hypothetical protein FWF86_08870, partial [Clostridia bacterium]|nr:hypothetical protein [Clostridia bacterium]